MRVSAVLILATALGLSSASLVLAQGIPSPVRATIQEMDGMCRSVGGTPGSREGLLLSADINGDGVRDWVVDQVAYTCPGAGSLFSGSRGGDILVFAGTQGGGAAEPAYFNAYGASLVEGRIWLRLAGSWCGQRVTEATSTSELQGCDREVIWAGDRFDVGASRALPGMAEAPPPPTFRKARSDRRRL